MKLREIPEYWNKYLAEWDKDPQAKADEEKKHGRFFKYSRVLNAGIHYLPEPYYGDLQNPLCVIIDLNPGLSSPFDFKKDRNAEGCIYSFFHTHDYSKVNDYYSPFLQSSIAKNGTPCEVPGTQWWQNNRMKWIISFIKQYTGEPIRNNDPLALELCPWHSKKWSNSIIKTNSETEEKAMRQSLYNEIIEPSKEAILFSLVPFGFCFGLALGDLLLNCLGFKEITWNNTNRIGKWPKGKKGKFVDRTYRLLTKTIGDEIVSFLNIYSKGTYKAPSLKFQEDVEPYIINEIKAIILG